MKMKPTIKESNNTMTTATPERELSELPRLGRPPFELTDFEEQTIRDLSLSTSEAGEKIGRPASFVMSRRQKLGIRSERTGSRPIPVPEDLLFNPKLSHQDVADLCEPEVTAGVVSARRKEAGFRRYYPDAAWYEIEPKKDVNGYMRLHVPGHPCSMGASQQYAYEHQVVVYELGLSGSDWLDGVWHVHHRNEVKDDNRLENLILFYTGSAHLRHHSNLRNGMTELTSLSTFEDGAFKTFDPAINYTVS